jgi:hypothetical protein
MGWKIPWHGVNNFIRKGKREANSNMEGTEWVSRRKTIQ